ncbi:hypothetical protein QBC43DRAFT_351784 [Cladorrhinum sp. PSN259]|nr:hypothetical protein QBC43DRAFT_351784 [Cladorrhinum sp. PSN259]
MPSCKIKTSACTVQNRNNQRLSRARRKEFVEDLQRRLQEYERRGVEASLEMQRASRSIVLENQRLRALLAARGVSQHEITAHLSAPAALCDTSEALSKSAPTAWHRPPLGTGQTGGTVKAAARPRAGSRLSRAADHLPSPPTTAVSSLSPALAGRAPPGSASPVSSVSTTGDSAMEDHRREPGQEVHYQAPWPSLPDRGFISPPFCDTPGQHASSILPPVSDCYCPPDSPALALDQTSRLEMSCEAAARILAEIRGYSDAAQELSALGCMGARDCMISNTKLFQLMDEM